MLNQVRLGQTACGWPVKPNSSTGKAGGLAAAKRACR